MKSIPKDLTEEQKKWFLQMLKSYRGSIIYIIEKVYTDKKMTKELKDMLFKEVYALTIRDLI